MKVLAAVSGGVDSAVAMARAVDAGHQVTAVHLALARDPRQRRMGARGCCSIEDSLDARRAADRLGVPFYVWDLSERFTEDVIEDFVAEYRAGRTPNPCLRCNERIKFSAVLERAVSLGFDAVATGHYARLVQGTQGPQLHRAADAAKDQSYVLGVLGVEQLRHCLFPLGDSTKPEVRAEAKRRGLAVAAKPDSHDICFIPDGDTAAWLQRQVGPVAGPIVEAESGLEVGRHAGTHTFTIGQRRGLGLNDPAADGRPRYVVGLEPTSNTVLIGPEALLRVSEIHAAPVSWAMRTPPAQEFRAVVQIRAHATPVPASVLPSAGATGFAVRLDEPLRAVAPGQSVVVYDHDRVLGQGTIVATRPPSRA